MDYSDVTPLTVFMTVCNHLLQRERVHFYSDPTNCKDFIVVEVGVNDLYLVVEHAVKNNRDFQISFKQVFVSSIKDYDGDSHYNLFTELLYDFNVVGRVMDDC